MFSLLLSLALLLGLTLADPIVTPDKIRVFLFAAPSFYSEVGVDVRNNTCLSLDNNLIDGRVKSVLVGGHDVWLVQARNDKWYCVLWDNYQCQGSNDQRLFIPGGENNLVSAGWGSRVHGVQCFNPGEGSHGFESNYRGDIFDDAKRSTNVPIWQSCRSHGWMPMISKSCRVEEGHNCHLPGDKQETVRMDGVGKMQQRMTRGVSYIEKESLD